MAAAPTAELKFRVWAGPGPGSGVLGSVTLAGLGPENQGRRNQWRLSTEAFRWTNCQALQATPTNFVWSCNRSKPWRQTYLFILIRAVKFWDKLGTR